MLEVLKKFAAGTATAKDVDLLKRLSNTMTRASFCGLGQAAATALSTGLKLFRAEFEAHLKGTCPADVCFKNKKGGA